MIGRRSFITAFPATALAVLARSGDAYVPAGLLSADSEVGHEVAAVTLDGLKVSDVTEANDVEGWLTRLVIGEHGIERQERLVGEVRFVWKRPASGP